MSDKRIFGQATLLFVVNVYSFYVLLGFQANTLFLLLIKLLNYVEPSKCEPSNTGEYNRIGGWLLQA